MRYSLHLAAFSYCDPFTAHPIVFPPTSSSSPPTAPPGSTEQTPTREAIYGTKSKGGLTGQGKRTRTRPRCRKREERKDEIEGVRRGGCVSGRRGGAGLDEAGLETVDPDKKRKGQYEVKGGKKVDALDGVLVDTFVNENVEDVLALVTLELDNCGRKTVKFRSTVRGGRHGK